MTHENYLVLDKNYSFLQELGLEELNCGVYNGSWAANGKVTAHCNQAIAHIREQICQFLYYCYPVIFTDIMDN